MAIGRIKAKKSKLLKVLVAAGLDKRRMLRELAKVEYINNNTGRLISAFTWGGQPQGHGYWWGIEKAIGQCTLS